MSWARQPAEKLSLAVRKNIRDKWESKKAEHESEIATFLGVEQFTITVDFNAVFPYAEARNYADSIGNLVNEYYSSLERRLGDYTKQGKDEEAKEALRKVLTKRSSSFQATDAKGISYCGLQIVDGELLVVFNHQNFASNISDVADKIDSVVDDALDALGENDLPIVTRRSIAKSLTPKIPEWQDKLQEFFGKQYTFEYDVRAALDKLKQFPNEISWFKDRINQALPQFISNYFESLVNNLEYLKFGKDEMLQEAFVEATSSLVIRFEVVDSLPKGKNYNNAAFVDGELRLQAAPKNFASNIDEIGRDLVDKL